MKTYCVANNGDCHTCLLASKMLDCANYPLANQELHKTLREQAQERVDRTPLLKAHDDAIMHWLDRVRALEMGAA